MSDQIAIPRLGAYVTTNEVVEVCACRIKGFDEPLLIEITGIRDRHTEQYREFRVEIKAPKDMHARLERVMNTGKPDRILIPGR